MELSRILSRYIKTTNFEDMPEEVVDFTKTCTLDYFASAFIGATTEPIKIIDAFIKEMGGDKQVSLITSGKSSVMNAVLVNGAASHIAELDDIHKSSVIHAATVVIPTALAVAEAENKTGKDLIAAITIGYEVCYRIGEAVTPSHYYYWHNTATCGTFGAVAAAAKLLELNEEQIIHALGNAGTQAAGLWQFIEDGAMSKQLHPGKAAMNGVLSAYLSKKGFTGARQILEGDRGFFKAMSTDYDAKKITNELGNEFKIMENSFKVHASCRHTHSAMDLMIALRQEGVITLEEIDSIIVRTYQTAIDITDNSNPTTQYESKFSLQFCTALAFIEGQGGLDKFNNDTLWSTDIRDLMNRVKITIDREVDMSYPEKWGASINIYLTNGEVIERKTLFPKGDPENAVNTEDIKSKFEKLAVNLSEKDKKYFIDYLLNLENMDDVRKLMSYTQ